ncbi:daptide biosynthesis RiPP recognition protein [Streptomyces chrestomyceticus]|uniref:daptide biosynthesis RiPP recognition protein n=1 Tax=Streptomyces chrestomyceticus TaxID=68185 RepID=UPI0037A99824
MPKIKESLMAWATGHDSQHEIAGAEQQNGCRTVVLESSEHLAQVLASDVVGAHTLVFAPAFSQADTADGSSPDVAVYGGSAGESGAEFSLGTDFYLQVQSYGISGYMSVIGPTLVRIADTADFEAYVADADQARQDGTFPEFLASPVVQLADLPALGAAHADTGPALRLYVAATGAVSTSPGGRPLGVAGESLAVLEAEWNRVNGEAVRPCAVSLGAAVPEEARTTGLAERPWLGRYLAALDALRNLAGRATTGASVSGFGGRFLPALAKISSPADAMGTEVPLLLWTDEAAYVYVPNTNRMMQLRREAAALVEALLVCGSVEAAAAHADRKKLLQMERALADMSVPLRVQPHERSRAGR